MNIKPSKSQLELLSLLAAPKTFVMLNWGHRGRWAFVCGDYSHPNRNISVHPRSVIGLEGRGLIEKVAGEELIYVSYSITPKGREVLARVTNAKATGH
jgi:hypothetical protein